MKVVAGLAFAALLLGACSGGGGTAAPAAPGEQGEASAVVTAVKSYRFEPQNIEVTAGDEVEWVNEDDFPHNVHFLTGRDDTYDLSIDGTATVTFDEAGTYEYECSLHPSQMSGTVTVTR